MKYRYIDPKSNVVLDLSTDNLKIELNKSFKNWLLGSGDASIEGNIPELIIIKVKDGIFIMNLSDYSVPIISSDEQVTVIEHYVSGEPFMIPSISLCNEDTAFNILSHYIETNGELLNQFEWVDLYSIIEDNNY